MQTQRFTQSALILLATLSLPWLSLTLVHAQIVFENGNVTAPQEAGTYKIEPAAGTLRGPENLEYRFSRFDLPQATDKASFTGPAPGVQNVIGLINSGGQSVVNGTLSCDIPEANLYLLNPNGILIGPTATVNVPGSFYAAAASSVTVGGQTFGVTGNSPIVSAIRANIADFGFVRNPGPLSIQGKIQVGGPTSTVNLVGNDIAVQNATVSQPGNFEAKGTTVNVQNSTIETTNSGSTVKMEGDQITIENSKVSANATGSEDSKGIEVTGKSSVTVANSSLEGAGTGAGGGEDRIVNAKIEVNSESDENKQINLRGEDLTVDNSQIRSPDGGTVSLSASNINLINGTEINAGTKSAGRQGVVQLTADSVSLSNRSSIEMKNSQEGNGGEVSIKANTVKLTGQSRIGVPSSGINDAGTIEIQPTQIQTTGTNSSVTLDNSTIEASSNFTGAGGSVSITASNLKLDNQSSINANSNSTEENAGATGIIKISAKTGEGTVKVLNGSSIQTQTLGNGEARYINIQAKKLELDTDAKISAKTDGKGDAGEINIIPVENEGSVTLKNNSIIEVSTESQGKGGKLTITANQLQLDNSWVKGSASGEGDAADIQITATTGIGSVALDHQSVIETPTFAKGRGGKITIDANQVKLTNDSRIGAYTTARGEGGEGGEIEIDTGTLDVTKSSIAVGTLGDRMGGSLKITARNYINLSGETSLVTGEHIIKNIKGEEQRIRLPLFAIAADSRYGGGNVKGSNMVDSQDYAVYVKTPSLTINDGAVISTTTFGSGHGGKLRIEADTLEVNNSNIIATSIGGSTTEGGGSVEIVTNHFELVGKRPENGWMAAFEKDPFNLEFGSVDVSTHVDLSHEKSIRHAGILTIRPLAGKLLDISLLDGATIRSATDNQGNGGNVSIATSTLKLDNKSSIDASTTSTEEDAGKAGLIRINAKTGEGSVKVLNGSSIQARTSGEGDAQYINIQAKKIELDTDAEISAKTEGNGRAGEIRLTPVENEGLVTLKNNSTIEVSTESQGEGGNLTITANQLQLDNNSNVKATASAKGSAGDIEITTTTGEGAISLTNNSAIQAKADAEGNAGHVKINASGTLTAQDSQITTESAKSKGGDIEVNTPALTVTGAGGSINASVSGSQAGGNITVNVDSLTVTDGGSLKSSTDGQGQGGNVTVNANTVVSISGQSSTLASATTDGGPAGSIHITSPQLAVAQGGTIDTSSTAQGNSGNITVQTTGLSLSDQAQITAKATAEGHSGDIQVTTGTLNMNNNAVISADSSEGTGNAGSIQINTATQKAESISVTNHSKITTKANTGAGGTIELHSRDFTLENSEINAEVISGTDSATPATVTLDTQRLISRNGEIKSSSGGQSSAGNIAITATEYIELTGTDIISETTGSGAAGTITLGTQDAPLPSLTLRSTNISTTSSGSGDSGEIGLVVNGDLNLEGATLKSESTGGGRADAKPANITVKSNTLTLDGASKISSSTEGVSPAGTITVNANQVTNSGVIASEARGSGPAGAIQIGNQQRVSELTVNPSGTISTTATGTGASGTIDLYADKVTVNGGKIQSQAKGPGNSNNPRADIRFHEANELTLTQAGEVSSSTSGASPAGTITVNATKVNLSNGKITSDAEATATGPAGAIVIGGEKQRVSELNVEKDSIISTTAKGTSASGNVELHVDTLKVNGEIKSEAKDLGKDSSVASITVDKVGTLTMTGGKITTSTTGSRDAGGIEVTVASPGNSTVNIQGGEIRSNADSGAKGDAGQIQVGQNGQPFGNVTLNNGKIETKANVSNSGQIGVYAENLEVTGTSSINAENTGGRADGQKEANIEVRATESLKVKDSGKITSSTSGQNPAGTITIIAPKIDIGTTATNGTTCTTTPCGRIESSTTGSGAAGTISISASEYIEISGVESGIFSTSSASGKAGGIVVAERVVEGKGEGLIKQGLMLSHGGQISTNASGNSLGGGSIAVHATTLKVGDNSAITSVSSSNQKGETANIVVNTNQTTLSQGGRIESSTKGASAAGEITVAANQIDISGEAKTPNEEINSGIFSKADTGATGPAGKITVAKELTGNGSVDRLTISNGGQINTEADVSDSGQIDIHADTLEVSGKDSSIKAENKTGGQGAGLLANVNFQGHTLTLKEGGNITSSTMGQNNAGTISISASDYIEISGGGSGIFSASGGGDDSTKSVTGNAGQIILGEQASVPKLTLTKGGQISTSSFQNSTGEGGNITVHANDLSLDNANILAESQGAGKEGTGKTAGSVTIEAKNGVDLKNHAKVSAKNEGTGKAGSVTISSNTLHVNDSEINTQQLSQGEGGKVQITTTDEITVDKGNIMATVNNRPVQENLQQTTADIQITAPRLTLTSGKVESSTTGTSEAGQITITASQYLELAGNGSSILSNSAGAGKAGDINITAGGTGEGTKFNSETLNTKGTISYFTASAGTHGIVLGEGGKISTDTTKNTVMAGNGGDITVTTSQLTLKKGAEISANESGAANKAGSIVIGTDELTMLNGSKISTTAEGAQEGGGNILIGVNQVPIADPNKSRIPRVSGEITASVKGGAGKGGNVEITSNNKEVLNQKGLLFVLDGGNITAKADEGQGGEIKIGVPRYFLQSSNSELSASSRAGIDGQVRTDASQVDMGAISRLPGEPVDVSKLVKDCAKQTQGQWSLRQGGRSSSKVDKEKNTEEGCKR